MIVANGILGVRNRAGVAKDVFRWREDTASGTVLGPQIVACGRGVAGQLGVVPNCLLARELSWHSPPIWER